MRTYLAALLLGARMAAAQTPHVHQLPATPTTVAWGYYSAAAKPVLHIASGDIVVVHTVLTNVPDRLEQAGLPAARVQQSLRDITTQVTDKGPGGHILTGPIAVDGAEVGDVLEVRILEVRPDIDYGYNGCSGFLRENCTDSGRTRIIQLDTVHMTASLGPDITIPLHPFFGSMGDAPPPDSGRLSSNPPGTHAGNLDNKYLVAGTTLFIPIQAPGALFEIGDGHVAQGDGEVDQTAIETFARRPHPIGRSEGSPSDLAAGGDTDVLHHDGNRQRFDAGDESRGAGDGRFPVVDAGALEDGSVPTREHRGRLTHHGAGRRQRRCAHDDSQVDLQEALETREPGDGNEKDHLTPYFGWSAPSPSQMTCCTAAVGAARLSHDERREVTD